MLFTMFILTITLTAAVGIYSIIATRNLLRVLIAMEVANKAAILLIIVAGVLNGQLQLAETFIIALIIVEVIVTAIGAVLCIAIYSQTGSLDISFLANRVKRGVAPEGVAPEGVAPEGVAPEGVAPEGVAPEGVAPERSLSTDVVPVEDTVLITDTVPLGDTVQERSITLTADVLSKGREVGNAF